MGFVVKVNQLQSNSKEIYYLISERQNGTKFWFPNFCCTSKDTNSKVMSIKVRLVHEKANGKRQWKAQNL